MCFGGGGGGGESVLQNELATISRQQWQDFLTRYGGLESDLARRSSDPAEITRAADRAGTLADQTAQATRGMTERSLDRYRTPLRADQRETMDRMRTAGEASTRNAAVNTARLVAKDQQDALRTDVIGLGQSMRQEALGNYGSAAGAENVRQQANIQARAQHQAGMMNLLGQGAGLASAFMLLSSKKAKKRIKRANTERHLSLVRDLDLVEYEYKKGQGEPGKRTGVIAEETPEPLSTGKAVSLGDAIFTLAGAMQEVDRRVMALERPKAAA